MPYVSTGDYTPPCRRSVCRSMSSHRSIWWRWPGTRGSKGTTSLYFQTWASQSDIAVFLDNWVLSGGHLVATGSSGVAGDGNVQLKSLSSSRRLALDDKREQLWSSYFAQPQPSVHGHVYTGPLIPLYGARHLFEWKVGTRGEYKLFPHAPFSPPEKAYDNIQVEQGRYGTGNFGRGKSVVIPFTVGRGYRELGLSIFRLFHKNTQQGR
ncbi:hypothetical protein BDW59DRAFT_135558 [Aspergillus cavernicola]|uniref:Uncharacterized protein n=1 Tax=Aspergillus cavernicola TaxID=176166 RepID=A0ABR4HN73_9EURO